MKINTMKLKLTALLLVLYTGLYAQNKIVLTAPRLDTSSLSNRINLKANTNLNNVNGVLSSTYGGAGSVNGILKANGSGVVSPVIASDITTLISGTYLPLSGGTLTGALNGTSAAFSGAGLFGTSTALSGIAGGIATNSATSSGMNMRVSDVNKGYVYVSGSDVLMEGAASMNVKLLTTSGYYYNLAPSGLATSNAIRTLFNTTTDNGTDALQVAGSGLFSSSVTALGGNFNTSSGGSSLILANTGAQNSNGLEIRGGTAGTTVNWKIEKDNTLSQNLQFTPSTANGGTSFTTPVLSLSSTGAITASSSVTATNATLTASTASTSTTTGALIVTGGVGVGGAIWAGSGFFESDKRWKNIDSRIASNSSIDAIRWTWNDSHKIDNRQHWGYSAQEVLEVLPEAVSKTNEGFYGIEYNSVFTYKIANLEKLVSELEKELKKLKTKKLKLK